MATPEEQIKQGMVAIGKSLNAPAAAIIACLVIGYQENSWNTDSCNSSNHCGIFQLDSNWQAQHDYHDWAYWTHYAYTNGFFSNGGLIAISKTTSDIGQIVQNCQGAGGPDPAGYYDQAVGPATADYNRLAGQNLPVPTTGAGTPTGTTANPTSPSSLWTVGNASNPDQDYFTTINQYSQNAQWYTFSDGETLYVADGVELMAQQPQAVILRTDPAVVSTTCTYDNTAFQYASTHKKRGRIQRKSSLAKLTSPTEVTIRIICDIDLFRAGDVAYLKLFGPADGLWLIGNATRSVFQPYTDLTLVQAMQPINALTGTTSGPSFTSGAAASAPTAGTVIAAMVKEATTINNDDYTYVWGGGHGQAGTPSIGVPGGNGFDGHTKGFDCSGAVGAVLAAGGILTWGGSVPSSSGIVNQLLGQNKVVGGNGSGSPECTLFDTSDHIFMRLDGEYWGTADGVGNLPATPNQGSGWIPNGQPGSGFRVTHIPVNILGQQPAPGAGP